jgi:predicted small lipoprotein YifL
MKKALYLAVLLIFALSLAACGQPTPTTVVPPATATPVPPPALTLEALKNAEYQSEFPKSKKARLTDGKYEEEIVPGSASKLVIVVYPDMYAFGDLNGDGVDDAAVVLATSGGGSGTFISLEAVINDKGTPKHIASASLGDRARIQSIAIQSGEITVNMITHGPQDPLCCPTLEVTQKYKLQGDKLTQVSSTSATSVSFAGTYKAQLPAADAAGRNLTLVLNADKSATLTTEYIGKGTIVQKGTWSSSGSSVTVTLTEQDGRPVKVEITFELKGDELVATQWDQNLYGSVGPGTYKKQ